MDLIITSGRFTSTQIWRLNYCRLFLQAVTVLDIATTSGFALDISKRNGHPSRPQSIETQWLHVNQERPSNDFWRLWKKANLLWSDVDGKLHQPLGKWTTSIDKQRQRHYAYQCGLRLAIRTSTGYVIRAIISVSTICVKRYHAPLLLPPQGSSSHGDYILHRDPILCDHIGRSKQ